MTTSVASFVAQLPEPWASLLRAGRPIKTLTLTQPRASLVALDAKRVETRSWSTPYRGPLAIHAAKGWTLADRQTVYEDAFWSVLQDLPELPLGKVIALTFLEDCRPIDMALRAHISAYGQVHELTFGDYRTGRYAWMLRNTIALPQPVPAKGALGLWDWTPEVAAA